MHNDQSAARRHEVLPGQPLDRPYRVKILDLGTQARELADDLRAALDDVVDRGWFITGPRLADFERAFASYVGVEHAVGVGTGTDAICLTLRAMGIGEGDEVVTVANTVYATARAVAMAGATPVFVDVDARTANMDPSKLDAVITSRTKAILPLHLYGSPVPFDEIAAIAKANGLPVIEDACQAAGASYDGRRCGSLGDAACFSFYPSKNLGGYGDGGMVVTNDAALADEVRRSRAYGQVARDVFVGYGINSRLDELQAAFLSAKLPRLDGWNARRREIAARYLAELPDCVRPVSESPKGTSNYHLFGVYSPERDRLRDFLDEQGIQTQVHYHVPLHRLEPFEHLGYKEGDLPATEDHCRSVLSLPLYPELDDDSVTAVIEAVQAFAREGAG